MLKKRLIPTDLVPPEDRVPVKIIEARSDRFRLLKIWFHIAHWLLNVLWMVLTRRWTQEWNARRTRHLMEELGFLWIKVGQLFSLREDIFSSAFCHELSNLQYQAYGFPAKVARRTVEEDLGGPLESFFEYFEELPFAAASIAQVHRARLKRSGVDVVVKIMRPNAIEMFEKDMSFYRLMVRIIARIPAVEFLHIEEGLWELEQIVSEEVDYRYEVSNIRRFRKNCRKHKRVYVPKPFRGYCTKRVIVMEMIKGALMSDFLKVRRTDPARVDEWMQANNIKPKKVAKNLLFSFMRHLFEENLFHGDLHPGNIMLLRNSRVGLIDLGSLGTAEGEVLRTYFFGMRAFAMGESQKGADLMLAFSPELLVVNLVAVKEDMVRALRAWQMRTHLRSLSYHEKSFSNMLIEIV